MPSHTLRPARARSADEKLARRGDILRAAERLWTSTPYAELSMNQVAREVQLAKGTLYLYFSTREELFLALLGDHYQRWFDRLSELLDERQPTSAADVAGTIMESLKDFELMRRLQLLLGSVLDSGDIALAFRQRVVEMMRKVAPKLPYPPQVGQQVLMQLEALCVGWQHVKEAAPSRRILALHPELQPLVLDIDKEMGLALEALLVKLTA